MRVDTAVLAAACGLFLCGSAFGDDGERRGRPGQASLLSGPVSERAQVGLAASERIRVIVMLRDQDSAAAHTRSLDGEAGRAAIAALDARRDRVISETLGLASPSLQAAHTPGQGRIYARFDISGGFAVTADAGEIEALARHPDVAGVFEDSLHAPSGPWGDPAAVPAPSAPDSLEPLRVHALWDAGLTGEGQTIAILDSGVAPDHIAMDGAIVAGACFSSTVDGESQSMCEGGVPELTSLDSGEPGADCLVRELDPDNGIAGCGHGTHVASLAAGRRVALNNNGANHYVFSGIAPDADIVAIQIFSQFQAKDCKNYTGGPNVPTCLLAWQSDYLKALEWLHTHQAELSLDVINMSFGGGEYRTPCEDVALRPVLQQLRDQDVFIFAAAGNESHRNGLAHPACLPETISVGASNSTQYAGSFSFDVAYFTNVSPYLDLVAPGRRLLAGWATGPTQNDGYGDYCVIRAHGGGNLTSTIDQGLCHYFDWSSGTSMASPTAAGAFALLRQGFPAASSEELLTAADLTGHISAHDLVGRMFSTLNLERTHDYLSQDRTILAGISMEPEAPFRAVNETLNVESYADGHYTLTNEGVTPAQIEITDIPAWLEVSDETLRILPGQSAELTLSIRQQLHLLPIHWTGHAGSHPRVEAVFLTLRSGAEQFQLPVSVSAFGVLEADGQFGPFPAVGQNDSGAASIIRIAGLHSGPPERLDLVFRDGTGSAQQASFVTCSLRIRNRRYQGAEYLITPPDLSDCPDLGFGQVYVHVQPQDNADLDQLRVRRFMLNSDSRLTDLIEDPDQNIQGPLTDHWSDAYDSSRSLQEGAPQFGPDAGQASPSGTSLAPEYRRVGISRFYWVGDHTNMMRSAFLFEGLNGLTPRLVYLEVVRPSGDISALTETGSFDAFYECEFEVREDRMSWDSYLILPEDYAVCGEFGRADVSPRLWITNDPGGPVVEHTRYIVAPGGALTDIGADRWLTFAPPRANEDGDYSVSLTTVFEWVGDANAPTENVFRFSPIDGALRSIDVAITNAARGTYAGGFGDCELEFDASRYTRADYIITSDDLAVCGDFGRADLQFRLNGPEDSFGRIVRAMRIGVGAQGDLTDFTFDHQFERGVSPERHADFDRVELGPYEWVGDTHAATQSVFRLVGLDGALPTRIQVRLANATYDPGWYEDSFTDCEIAVNPERSSGGEFLILSRDLAQCGDFGRADIHFRIEAPDGTMQEGMRIRRFAVTAGGGLTDFSSDNEIVPGVSGFD
ncbi:MAG: S8 family serine peptidase [Pseudomonadota bacterium]|nr:S8 family serine peptidase [Pseudomonadota bacterium]